MEKPLSSARKRRIQLRTRRSLLALLALCAPSILVVVPDLWRRASLLVQLPLHQLALYLGSVIGSFVFWLLLLLAAARRRGCARNVFAAVVIGVLTLQGGVQSAFFSLFRTYDSIDADLYTESFAWPLIGSLPLGMLHLWIALALSLLASVGTVAFARRVVRPGRAAARVATALGTGCVLALGFPASSYRPVQASTPDVLYVHALFGSYKEQLHLTDDVTEKRPQLRHALPVPRLDATGPRRNVLLILQESQRRDVTCTKYEPACALATRASNRAAPDRLPFMRWHSLDSSTILSCVSLFTGLLPSDPRDDLNAAPTVFGFAKAAGYETAYVTSQHLIFKNMRLQTQNEPIDRYVTATALDLRADWETGARDALLTDYLVEHWDSLPEPFFVVAHYSNQHLPYVVDPKHSPFVHDPAMREDDREERLTFYKNAVYLSDLAVGRLIDKVRHSPVGVRTAIAYTSDHGESFGEHGRSGHTISLYEAETRMPAWIDAPPGLLADEQMQHLRDAEDAWLTHVDLLPTLLDVMNLWDAPSLAPFRSKMRGHPITRELPPPRALPMTNDSWLWESTDRNWGYLQGPMKLFGTDGMDHYECFDVEQDPGERTPLPEAACGELGRLTRELFPALDQAKRPYRPLR